MKDNLTQYQTRVETVLGLKFDVEEDKEKGYPGVVCRWCCDDCDYDDYSDNYDDHTDSEGGDANTT